MDTSHDPNGEVIGKKPNPAYTGLRRDILSLVPPDPKSILDVGCAQGIMGAHLLKRFPGSRVCGVEADPDLASVARARLSRVWETDLNAHSLGELKDAGTFDLILFGDVLEHLIHPDAQLRAARELLSPEGLIITSLPNVMHYSTLLHLILLQKWPYRSRGIHDRTHLRFFTRRNLKDLFRHAGLKPIREKRNLRLWESGCALDPLSRLLDFWPFRPYFTFQYLHLLKPA